MTKKATLQLETLTCPTCMQKIAGAIKNVNGVVPTSVKIQFNASKAKAEFDDQQTSLQKIVDAIRALGYDVLKANAK